MNNKRKMKKKKKTISEIGITKFAKSGEIQLRIFGMGSHAIYNLVRLMIDCMQKVTTGEPGKEF
jgi:hypothetical protein